MLSVYSKFLIYYMHWIYIYLDITFSLSLSIYIYIYIYIYTFYPMNFGLSLLRAIKQSNIRNRLISFVHLIYQRVYQCFT